MGSFKELKTAHTTAWVVHHMDLAKLLRLRKTATVPVAETGNWSSLFLKKLAAAIKSDIGTLGRVSPEDEWVRLARIMKVYCGNLNDRSDPESNGYTYMFLNVPSKRGFMLEMNTGRERLELRKGTLIVPLKRNAFEELEQSTLFITSGPLLGDYRLLAPDLVRSAPDDKTFTITSMAEMLMSLAFGIEEPTPVGQREALATGTPENPALGPSEDQKKDLKAGSNEDPNRNLV
jgi:hypothetical protein